MVKFDQSIIENFLICKDNLSLVYIGSALITFLSVSIACFYHRHSSRKILLEKGKVNSYPQSATPLTPRNTEPLPSPSRLYTDPMKNEDIEEQEDTDSVLTNKSRQYIQLTDKIAKTLTADQLEEEKQVERQQLTAIFKLLQNQEDKFQIGSVQELEDQMKLYKY